MAQTKLSGVATRVTLLTVALAAVASQANADAFGSGSDAFDIDFVTIGDLNNPADTDGSPRPAGSVAYGYRISTFEISERMIDAANALGGLGITHSLRGPDKPATDVSWFEAARFVNWLNTSSGYEPAYKFVEVPAGGRGGGTVLEFALWEPGDPGYNPNNQFRNSLAQYVLPSSDEWYKAAYYDTETDSYFFFPTAGGVDPVAVASGTAAGTAVFQQDFAAGPADIMLAGGPGPNGTVAQGGNVGEWLETELDFLNDDPIGSRLGRGGFWDTTLSALSSSSLGSAPPETEFVATGFRVVSIPEPTAVLLAFAAANYLLFRATTG